MFWTVIAILVTVIVPEQKLLACWNTTMEFEDQGPQQYIVDQIEHDHGHHPHDKLSELLCELW